MKHTFRYITIAFFLFCNLSVAIAVDLVGTPNPTDTRTDTLAQAGYGFYLKSPILVTKLGFWVSPANSGNTGVLAANHTVVLYHYVPGTPNSAQELAQVTIPAGSTGDANKYAWANLSTPILLNDLTQGGDYFSFSQARAPTPGALLPVQILSHPRQPHILPSPVMVVGLPAHSPA